MQTGRMKGQAFIGLPDEGVAFTALQETNGFILHGKPMVVVRERECVCLPVTATIIDFTRLFFN